MTGTVVSLEVSSEPASFDWGEVLLLFHTAIDENADWLLNWHRAIIFGKTPGRRPVSEYALYGS